MNKLLHNELNEKRKNNLDMISYLLDYKTTAGKNDENAFKTPNDILLRKCFFQYSNKNDSETQ